MWLLMIVTLSDSKAWNHICINVVSVRKLLQEAGYNDLDLYYDELGNRI
jgi:amino acid permease